MPAGTGAGAREELQGWAVGDAGAGAGAGDDDAAAAQLRQGGRDRRRRHVESVASARTDGQASARRQRARGDRALDADAAMRFR